VPFCVVTGGHATIYLPTASVREKIIFQKSLIIIKSLQKRQNYLKEVEKKIFNSIKNFISKGFTVRRLPTFICTALV
jgi:hypothetical protein